MSKIKAIIIDDELDGREALKIAIEKYCPDISIMAIFDSPDSGLKASKAVQPDLVFLDVQMPHMSGFDLLQQAAPINFEVIFVTAHDQYAIKAIRFSALDYLLKPVDVEDLIHAVQKAQERLLQHNSVHKYQSVLNNIQYNTKRIERLAVPTFEGIEFFNTDDIIFCQADGNYSLLYLIDKQKKLISKNLKDFESLLISSGFCRVHHSFLINIKHVQKYIKGDGGYVVLTDNFHVDISRRKKEEFLGMLDKI
jgi:two-component system, LytTR family, response regulator